MGLVSEGWLLALAAKIWLGWHWVTIPNTLTDIGSLLIMAAESFMVHALTSSFYKAFLSQIVLKFLLQFQTVYKRECSLFKTCQLTATSIAKIFIGIIQVDTPVIFVFMTGIFVSKTSQLIKYFDQKNKLKYCFGMLKD